jgi:hypothetical protein
MVECDVLANGKFANPRTKRMGYIISSRMAGIFLSTLSIVNREIAARMGPEYDRLLASGHTTGLLSAAPRSSDCCNWLV